MELWGEVASDEWGKIGTRSKAGIYYWHSRKRNLLDEDTRYSTVIFSGNKSIGRCPTMIAARYEALYLFIKDKPQVLGTKCAETYYKHLPFQVKIRSMRKATALACHPNKEHAERLHRLDPERYYTDEHKPKLIIGKIGVELLAGFRNKEEIFSFLLAIPELAIVIPYVTIQDYLHSGKVMHLRRMLQSLLSATYQEMQLSLHILFERMENADETERAAIRYDLIKRFHDDYPYDVGVYAPLFFNHVVMEPGSAIFLPAGTVHAFLAGDCMEVTTCSQNIVRAGFTNLFTDVEEFLAISDFTSTTAESLIYQPTNIDEYLTSYTPPAKEFGVFRIRIILYVETCSHCLNEWNGKFDTIRLFVEYDNKVPAESSYTIKEKDSCSMLLVTRGSAMLEDSRIIKLGTTLFIFPYQIIKFKVRKDISMYVIYPNPDAPEGEYGKLF